MKILILSSFRFEFKNIQSQDILNLEYKIYISNISFSIVQSIMIILFLYFRIDNLKQMFGYLNFNLNFNKRNDRSLNASTYEEMIYSYLKDINRTPTKEEASVMELWKEISWSEKKKEAETPERDEDEEIFEIDICCGERWKW